MHKTFRLIVAVVALFCVFALSSLPVFANGASWFRLDSAYWFDASAQPPQWKLDSKASYTYTNEDTGVVQINSGAGIGTGFRFTLRAFGYVRISSGYYFSLSLGVSDSANQTYPNTEKYVKVYLTDDDGIVYDLPVVLKQETVNNITSYTATAGFRLEASRDNFNLGSITVESNFSCTGLLNYDIDLSFDMSTQPTLEQKRHDELMQEIDDLKHGWDTDDDSAGKLDDLGNQMEDLENGALGGKTDEDVKNEVDNAFTYDWGDFLSQQNLGIIAVGNSFNKLLNVFGMGYKSLLMLSLCLGLACFMIGKRYASGGGGK